MGGTAIIRFEGALEDSTPFEPSIAALQPRGEPRDSNDPTDPESKLYREMVAASMLLSRLAACHGSLYKPGLFFLFGLDTIFLSSPLR